jgi:hypothetical protein
LAGDVEVLALLLEPACATAIALAMASAHTSVNSFFMKSPSVLWMEERLPALLGHSLSQADLNTTKKKAARAAALN